MLRLQAGELVCELSPALGGAVAALRLGELPVLRPPPAEGLQSSRQAGSYPLVPWSNRIGDARLQWQGRRWDLPRNNPPEPHAIHGVGWQRAWTVGAADADSAHLHYRHAADAAWPFPFLAEQRFTLTPHGLTVEMAITHTGDGPAPAGLGWHPYLVKRPGARLRFAAAGRWEMGEDKLPTQRLPHAGLATGCDTLDVDHCFDGWDGVAELTDDLLRVRIASNLARLVVFTNATRGFVAIEPVSHVNNALALADRGLPLDGLGMATLAPGARLAARMEIAVSRSV